MEWWFFLAVTSALVSGLGAFAQKIGAQRGYNSALLTSYSAGISSLIGLCVALAMQDFTISPAVVLFAFLNGCIYVLGSIARMDALKYIDSTLYFPIYKVLGPIIIVFGGIIFFAETFSLVEWAGVVASMLVPLLLISRVEHTRQTNLPRGLWLVVVSAALTASAAIIAKEATNVLTSLFMFFAITHAFSFVSGLLLYRFIGRNRTLLAEFKDSLQGPFAALSLYAGVFQYLSILTLTFAFATGPLGLAYVINSLYILVPIVLSIYLYREHWNLRKVVAIALSIVALALLK